MTAGRFSSSTFASFQVLGIAFLLLFLAAGASPLTAQETPTEVSLNTEGPVQLLERGRSAFFAQDFATAEAVLEKFVLEYEGAEEAAEAVLIHRPLVAVAKLALGKYGEALPWIDESLRSGRMDRSLADDLAFCRGLCLTAQGELVAAQRAFGEYWVDESHDGFKRFESMLLFAALYVQQDFPSEAADLLEEQRPVLLAASPEVASRAAVLELHSRILAKEEAAALAIIVREGAQLAHMTQLASFQILVLQLGAKFLEAEKYHEAITCFQRVWPAERIAQHQAARIAEIERRIAELSGRVESRGAVQQLSSILEKTRREMERFSTIDHFDSSVRMRLALAFQGLGRYREAALILADMLVTLPPDPIVESASLAEIQCWMESKHWQRAVEAADRYLSVFGDDAARSSGADKTAPDGTALDVTAPSLAQVLFLRAEALREIADYSAAQRAFGDLVTRFPDDPFAAKAVFLQGFLYLQQDDDEGALHQFEQVRRLYPKAGLLDDADYWSAMAESFSGLYDEARESFLAYLQTYGQGAKYRVEAAYRVAFCTFSLADYPAAVDQLSGFLNEHADTALADEACLLLGDALFAEGRSEEGFAAYERVREQSGRFFEEAWFKKGKALRLLEEWDAMREHFEIFVRDHPASGRLPEAVYWIGWTYQQEDEIEKARDIYWKIIEEMGDDPSRRSMVDLLAGLPRVYALAGAAGREDLIFRLQQMKSRAVIADQKTLARRIGWTLSLIVPGDRPRTELLDITKWLDAHHSEPTISVAVAEAQLASGNRHVAKDLFTEIRRWNPRAVERDRIYRGLAEIYAAEEKLDQALSYYRRFERETFASVELGPARLRMSELLETLGRPEEARETLEKALADAATSAEVKAKALLRIGLSYSGQGRHEKSAFYFERVYVAYSGFGALNAQAYWERGQILEKMERPREALETYSEFVGRKDLESFPERSDALHRVADLQARLPKEETNPEGLL